MATQMQLEVILAENRIATRARKDRENEKVADGPAKLNEKKSDRELEREIKKREDIFCWKNNMKNL